MPIFISYSHDDAAFVDRLAVDLVKNRSSVWIDRWELNVGDSIVQRVQDALLTSSAILVVLSKASVESEWCKKELSAGLVRELDERRVLLLPLLIEECEIPLLLRDKLFADFRTDYDKGLRSVLDAIAAVSNSDQSRISNNEQTLDWAADWWYEQDQLVVRFTMIEAPKDLALTLLTEVVAVASPEATKRHREFEAAGLDWVSRHTIAGLLFDIANEQEIHLALDDQLPKSFAIEVDDRNKTGRSYSITVTSRRLGQDNGKIQIVRVSNYLKAIQGYLREVQRQPSAEEITKMLSIMMS